MTLQTNLKSSTLLAITMTVLVVGISSSVAYADHPLDVIGTWSNGIGTDVCYDTNELNNISIGGTWNHATEIKKELDDARAEWNNQVSTFALWKDSSCISSDQWVGSANLGLFGDLAVTYISTSGGNLVDTDTDFNTQKQFEIESNTCNWWDWDIEWVANHEFGHWVSFDHSTATSNTHSVMKGNCVTGWADVQSADASQLDDLY